MILFILPGEITISLQMVGLHWRHLVRDAIVEAGIFNHDFERKWKIVNLKAYLKKIIDKIVLHAPLEN